MRESDQYIVKPLDKALRLLDVVAASPVPLTLKQIAIDTGLPKTTAFKYLVTLRHRGLLAMEPDTGRITLGSTAFLLASRGARLHRLRQICLPTMVDLRDQFCETVNLAVLEAGEVVYIGVAQSPLELRAFDREGRRDPAILTALGRAIIAAQDPSSWPSFVVNDAGKRMSVPSGRVYDALQDAVLKGYACDDGDNVSGLSCVGAAICDGAGKPIASISVAAPSARLEAGRRSEIVAALMARTTALSGSTALQ